MCTLFFSFKKSWHVWKKMIRWKISIVMKYSWSWFFKECHYQYTSYTQTMLGTHTFEVEVFFVPCVFRDKCCFHTHHWCTADRSVSGWMLCGWLHAELFHNHWMQPVPEPQQDDWRFTEQNVTLFKGKYIWDVFLPLLRLFLSLKSLKRP